MGLAPRTRALLTLLRGVSTVTGRVPRSASEPICRVVGLASYLALPAQRAAVYDNLCHILGRAPARSMVMQVFVYGALNYWDTFALPQLRREELLELIHADGWEHLDAALQAGKGVIMVGAHLSNPALSAQSFAARGYGVTAVVEAMDPPELLDFISGLRAGIGVRLVPVGRGAARELLGALKRNEIAGIIADRDIHGTGPMVAFFGASTTFTDGPATLSLRTGAPILSAVSIRLPDGRYRGWIEPAVEAPRTGAFQTDVVSLTQAVAHRLEYHIGTHPEQWTVFQRRWPSSATVARRQV